MEKTGSSEASLAAAAIAVALAALSIAIVQLLGQLFATADGYRRCQPSVMGAWAQYTKLRWKWSEMRFETLFTTPEIFLQTFLVMTATPTEGWNWVTHLPGVTESPYLAFDSYATRVESLDPKLVDPDLGTGVYHEKVCWLSFLAGIQENESKMFKPHFPEPTYCYTLRRAACRPVRRSWDFMPPDLVRPLGMISVGDIAVMVERLGMTWQAFSPEEGEMTAEGNGHMIYSTFDRSIGNILHYVNGNIRSTTPDKFTKDQLRASAQSITPPTVEVDMMRFGILPCHELMNESFIPIGTPEEITVALEHLDPSRFSGEKVADTRKKFEGGTYGFPDLIPMAAPMLRARGSCKIRLPRPTMTCEGLLSRKEGFMVFSQRLDEYVNSSQDEGSGCARWVLKVFDELDDLHECWRKGLSRAFVADPDIPFLDRVFELWDDTTVYFENMQAREDIRFNYADLVACHIRHAVDFRQEAHQRIEDNEQRETDAHIDWIVEGMHLYWDYLPSIASELFKDFGVPEAWIKDAWIMLIFRAFLWSRSHLVCAPNAGTEFKVLPSRYWNSQLPVYLG
ncbi:MAG: hypothetical protein Q9208_007978 [Pyrenodesmia sp. 3 TL-2023]